MLTRMKMRCSGDKKGMKWLVGVVINANYRKCEWRRYVLRTINIVVHGIHFVKQWSGPRTAKMAGLKKVDQCGRGAGSGRVWSLIPMV